MQPNLTVAGISKFGRILLAALLICANGFLVNESSAQDNLSLSSVEQRLAVLRDSGAEEDSEIVKVYGEAGELLTQADSFDRDTSDYIENLTNAPAIEAEIQARMDARDHTVLQEIDLANLERENLQERLAVARAEVDDAGQRMADLSARLNSRESNTDKNRQRMIELKGVLDALPVKDISVNLAGRPTLAEARDWRETAKHRVLSAERHALNARLDSQPVRYNLIALERTEAEKSLERNSKLVHAIEAALRDKVSDALDPHSSGFEPDAPVFPIADELATRDSQLREEWISIDERLARVRAGIEEIDRRSRDLKEQFANARRVVEFASQSEVLGSILLAYWEEVNDSRIVDPTADSSRETAGVVVRRIERERELRGLSSANEFIDGQLDEFALTEEGVSQNNHEALVKMAGTYRDHLRIVLLIESEYLDALGEIREEYRALRKLTREYESFLKGRMIWIPAHPALWKISGTAISEEVAAIRNFAETIRLSRTIPLTLGVIVFLVLYSRQDYFKEKQQSLDKLIVRPRDDNIRHTLNAMALVALRALPISILLFGVGYSLNPAYLTQITTTVAAGIFLPQVCRILCEPAGVASLHFKWSEQRTSGFRREMSRLIYLWIPLAALAAITVHATGGAGETVLARLGIILLVALALILLFKVLVEAAGLAPGRWYEESGNQFRLFIIVALLVLAVAVSLGHVYSVTVVFGGLLDTLRIVILLLLLQSVLMRWVRITRRKLRLAQLINARTHTEPTKEELAEEYEASVGDMSAETAELINVGILSVAAITLYYVWSPLLPALGVLQDVALWTSTSLVEGEMVERQISLATLLAVMVLIVLIFYASHKLPALVDMILRSRTTASTSARYTASTLLNYLIIGGGIIVALAALGLQWSQLQWLVAALGVGIGFGLQEIIANFISGIIILFEQPIRVGDVVSTGDKDGVVTRIRIRATTIRDWDGRELLVPNKEFITGRLLNWSLSDSKIRVVLPVGIAYGSDVELAIKSLYKIVQGHPRVVNEPEPQVVFESFGDNALLLSARVYLNSLENRMGVVTELNHRIYKCFEELGIVIAFPQRDVHLEADKPIRVAVEPLESKQDKDSES